MHEPDSFIQLILSRLERISVDSPLAHRASGVRGSLLRSLETRHPDPPTTDKQLDEALNAALGILRQAAMQAGRKR